MRLEWTGVIWRDRFLPGQLMVPKDESTASVVEAKSVMGKVPEIVLMEWVVEPVVVKESLVMTEVPVVVEAMAEAGMRPPVMAGVVTEVAVASPCGPGRSRLEKDEDGAYHNNRATRLPDHCCTPSSSGLHRSSLYLLRLTCREFYFKKNCRFSGSRPKFVSEVHLLLG